MKWFPDIGYEVVKTSELAFQTKRDTIRFRGQKKKKKKNHT
jgi:hypothetical protein